MRNIIFISKDALNIHALPVYGNNFWQTPNIDKIAKNGTVFNRHYTAAASTAMAFTAMAIGDYCYKTDRKEYKNEGAINGDTIFDKIYDAGYECHIIWDETYTAFTETHFRCEGLHTQIHSMKQIKSLHTRHVRGVFDDMRPDDSETDKAVGLICEELTNIKNNATREGIFIWMHLPHVMRGRQGYGSDIDIFDRIIGEAAAIFGESDIFVSADHGHMDGTKDKFRYGYDVGEEVIRIPLITPRLQDDAETVDFPTSTIQMLDILLRRKVEPLEFVMSETAYYAQPKRKLAIIKDKYKYCYSKEEKKEFLYDLEFDPYENHNLVYPELFDTDRHLWHSTAQAFYYPYWNEAQVVLAEMREIKEDMWRNGTWFEENYNKLLHRVKMLYDRVRALRPDEHIENIGK